jgi:hypothetical protein
MQGRKKTYETGNEKDEREIKGETKKNGIKINVPDCGQNTVTLTH